MNGLDAATAMIDIQTKNGPGIAQLTAIRFGDMTVRIAAVTARDSGRDRNLLNTATQSFRRLTDKEVSRLHPFRIKIVTVGTRDTVRSIAKKMPIGKFSREVFLAMNGYRDETEMRVGDLVKVIE